MPRSRRALPSRLALACTLSWSAPALASARETLPPIEGDPIAVVQVRLDNGLTVLLSENHARAEVFGAIVVDVGGKNDPARDTGMAHYLEHMLFKGTRELGTSDWKAERPLLGRIEALYEKLAAANDVETRSAVTREIDLLSQSAARFAIPNELDRLLAEMGGRDVNAFTSNDVTAYYNVFPASQIETWLEVYAHRFEEPVFRLFAPELEAVYEEKNSSMEGFVEPAYEAFMRRFFPGHPYGRAVLGEVEHLKRPSLRAMREHFDTWYVANNMALVIAGDFETDAILPIIEEKFGRWRSGELPFRELPAVRPFEGREQVDVRLTPVRAAAIGYRTPPRGHADYPAMMIARELLSNTQGAGALDRLAADGKLLFAQVMDMDFHEHDGTVLFYAPRLLTQSFAGAEALVQGELERLRSGSVRQTEVDAVRRNLLRDIELQWEDNEARALAMADTWARGERWSDYLAMIAALRTVSVHDISGATTRWLGKDYLTMRSRRGQPDRTRLPKPDYTPIAPAGSEHSPYYRKIHPLPDDGVSPRYVDFDAAVERQDAAPGVRIVANENPFNGVYRLELRFGIGRDDLPELDVLGDYLLLAGTRAHPKSTFSARLFELATTLEAFATGDRFVLRIEGPEDRLDDTLALVRELMQSPAADRRRRGRLRRETWASERLAKSDPAEVANALWEHALYGDRSTYRRFGHRASRRHGVHDLLAAWDTAQGRDVEVRWVGKRSAEDVAALVASALPLRSSLAPAVAPIERPRTAIEYDRVFFVPRRDAVQAQVWFFVEGDPVAPADAVAMDAYNEYMGGAMGGLVFQEIRELRALAYSAFGGFQEADLRGFPGYFYGYVGCQSDKTTEAIEVMRSLIREMPKKPERVSAVRSSLMRAQEAADPAFRELQSTIETWRRRGYDHDPRRDRMPGYRDLRFADIERFWGKYLRGRPIALVVVGDPGRIDHDVLQNHGPVTKIRANRLYRPPRRARVR